MKTKLALISIVTLILTACSNSNIKYKQPNELRKIKHVCIIQNPKSKVANYESYLQTALTKHNITSEIVERSDKKRLYEEKCTYNLRYNIYQIESANQIDHAKFLIRTPKTEISTMTYTRKFDQPNIFRNLQIQADYLIARLLNK